MPQTPDVTQIPDVTIGADGRLVNHTGRVGTNARLNWSTPSPGYRRAYFIGGPLDLSMRVLERHMNEYEVALMDAVHVTNTQQERELHVAPRRGRYRNVGPVQSREVRDAYIFVWEGEV